MTLNLEKYNINKQLLDDIQCIHKVKKRPYIKYCISCKKNLCTWCKGHESHNIVSLDSLEPDEEKYKVCEDKLIEMQSIEDEIKKKDSEVFQIKQDINDLNDLINEIYEEVKNYNYEYSAHLKFNSLFFNYYKNDKRNYYILTNLNNLNFTTEIEFLDNLIIIQNLKK